MICTNCRGRFQKEELRGLLVLRVMIDTVVSILSVLIVVKKKIVATRQGGML